MRQKLRSIVLVALLAITASCNDDENSQVQWGEIEFPGEVVIHAIYGDLNDYMLISTISKILRTADGGKTWTTVKTVADPIASFNSLNEDLYAVSNFTDYISHDQGQTWEPVAFHYEVSFRSYSFNDSKGFLYQVVGHVDGELALPTSFLRSINKGDSWENIFPYKRGISSWHINANDKVYLGTSHPIWDGKFFNEDPELSARLYYMK